MRKNSKRVEQPKLTPDTWVMLYTRDCSFRVPLLHEDLTRTPWKVQRLRVERGPHAHPEYVFVSTSQSIDAFIERRKMRVHPKLATELRAHLNGFKR